MDEDDIEADNFSFGAFAFGTAGNHNHNAGVHDVLGKKYSDSLRILNDFRSQILAKRNNLFFNRFVAVSASITSWCHDRCQQLINRERIHLEKQIEILDTQINELRSRLELLPNPTQFSDLAEVERELSLIDQESLRLRYLEEFELDDAPLRAALTAFFDDAENNLDMFYEAKHAGRSPNFHPQRPKLGATRSKPEPKRKALTALETITNATAKLHAKRVRQVASTSAIDQDLNNLPRSSQPSSTVDTIEQQSQKDEYSASARDEFLSALAFAKVSASDSDNEAPQMSVLPSSCGLSAYFDPAMPKAGDVFECYVQHLETVDELYVVRCRDYDSCTPRVNTAIAELLSHEQISSSNVGSGLFAFDPDDLQIGGACIAKFEDDGNWYRATILRSDAASRRVKVRFVDFGNERYVPLPGSGWSGRSGRKMIPINSHQGQLQATLLHLPTQALRCALAGVKLRGNLSTSTTYESIYSQLLDVKLVARVLNVRRLYAVATGGFLPPECDGIGNPTVCDVLLCFADRLGKHGYDNQSVTSVTSISDPAWLECSVQAHLVECRSPLLDYVGISSVSGTATKSLLPIAHAKSFSVQMEAPVYITCVEAPNAIYIVRKQKDTVRQLLTLHTQLALFMQTYSSLVDQDQDLDVVETVEQARFFLLETFRQEFDALRLHELKLEDADLDADDAESQWRANAAVWKHLALPCVWLRPQTDRKQPLWLRGLLTQVDFNRNTLDIVSIDYGGTARLPLTGGSTMPLVKRLYRLAPQFALHAVPPFAACVCLTDLVSAGTLLPQSGCVTRNASHPCGIFDRAQLAAAYQMHLNMAWVSKAVETLGHSVFLSPDWMSIAAPFGDHIPVILHPDGSVEGYDCEDSVDLADEYETSRRADEKVRGDALAQRAVYLRLPTESVFSGIEEYETVKRELATWLHAGCAAPLPLDGSTRIDFRWPKAGVNLLVKRQRQRHRIPPAGAAATTNTGASDRETDFEYVNLGEHLISNGLAFRLTASL